MFSFNPIGKAMNGDKGDGSGLKRDESVIVEGMKKDEYMKHSPFKYIHFNLLF